MWKNTPLFIICKRIITFSNLLIKNIVLLFVSVIWLWLLVELIESQGDVDYVQFEWFLYLVVLNDMWFFNWNFTMAWRFLVFEGRFDDICHMFWASDKWILMFAYQFLLHAIVSLQNIRFRYGIIKSVELQLVWISLVPTRIFRDISLIIHTNILGFRES